MRDKELAMKEYIVHCYDTVEWDGIEEQSIDECRWSPNTAPAAGMKAALLKDRALLVLVKSYCAPVRAENILPDSSVWEDSCLEFFFSFDGEKYVNLEVNANSALRASVLGQPGSSRLCRELNPRKLPR